MKKKMLVSVGASLLALLIAVPLAFADGPRDREGRRERGPHLLRMMDRMGLTEAQTGSVKALFDGQKAEMEAMHDQMKAAHQKLKAAWLDKAATPASVMAAHREVHALQGQMAERRIALGFALKAILTPEQFEKVAPKLMRHRGMGKHHFKHGRRGPVAGGPGCDGPPGDE